VYRCFLQFRVCFFDPENGPPCVDFIKLSQQSVLKLGPHLFWNFWVCVPQFVVLCSRVLSFSIIIRLVRFHRAGCVTCCIVFSVVLYRCWFWHVIILLMRFFKFYRSAASCNNCVLWKRDVHNPASTLHVRDCRWNVAELLMRNTWLVRMQMLITLSMHQRVCVCALTSRCPHTANYIFGICVACIHLCSMAMYLY